MSDSAQSIFDKEFCTIPELAVTLGVTDKTIYMWVRNGILPQTIRLGPKCTRFRTRDVREALDKAQGIEAA